MKKDNLPSKIKEILSSGKSFQQRLTQIQEKGQVRKEWTIHVKEKTQVNTNPQMVPNNALMR